MEIIIKASQFILSLSLLIILHELGHFIPARIFKTKVEKFFLFFDYKFSLFKKKIGDTVYGIGWIPLGGYVKIAGMIDESMDKEQLKKDPKPCEFRSKPAWQRLIIILGGVIVNFILGFLIYALMLFFNGEKYVVNQSLKGGVLSSELAKEIGIKTGDKITAIDGEPIKSFGSISAKIINGNTITVERAGRIENQNIPVNFIDKFLKNGKKQPIVGIRFPFVVGGFLDGSPNKNSGLKKGDMVTSVNEMPVRYFDEVTAIFQARPNDTLILKSKRKGQVFTHTVHTDDKGRIGVRLAMLPLEDLEKMGYLKVAQKEYGFFSAIPRGVQKGWATIVSYAKQLKKIFNPQTGAYKGVGGFIAMGKIFPNTWNWQAFWSITAFLSMMLGFLNLLPIPGLDGGHMMFILYELFTGRKPHEKVMEYAQIIGFILLISLLIFVNGNDVLKLFS